MMNRTIKSARGIGQIFRNGLNRKFMTLFLLGLGTGITTSVVAYLSSWIVAGFVFILLVPGLLFVLLTWLDHQITQPLERLTTCVAEMADGDLTESVPQNAWGEIGELARHVNAFSVNQQEMLLHLWNRNIDHQQSIEALIAHASETDGDTGEPAHVLTHVLDDFRETQIMLGMFKFYDITIRDGKAHAVNDLFSRRTT